MLIAERDIEVGLTLAKTIAREEIRTELARAAADANIPFTLATNAMTSMETIARGIERIGEAVAALR